MIRLIKVWPHGSNSCCDFLYEAIQFGKTVTFNASLGGQPPESFFRLPPESSHANATLDLPTKMDGLPARFGNDGKLLRGHVATIKLMVLYPNDLTHTPVTAKVAGTSCAR